MRLVAPFLFWAAAAAPAAAQVCEASISGKPGEVIASLETGKREPVSITWAVERREGMGEESDHFARPGLMLDFTMAPDGALVPSRALVSVTRYSDSKLGRAPAMSEVRVRATPRGSDAIVWAGDDPASGEAALVKRLKEAWPEELTVEVVAGGKVLAGSVFDLAVLSDVRAMAQQAAARCER